MQINYKESKVLSAIHSRIKFFKNSPRRFVEIYAKRIVHSLLPERVLLKRGHRRIYHYHTRKTGGTSLNYSFMRLVADKDYKKIYNKLVNSKDGSCIYKRRIFIAWNENLINRGKYFYAWSHNPYNKISVDNLTFTVAVIRDPVKRVVSLYKDTLHHKKMNFHQEHPRFKMQSGWLGKGFGDFIENASREYLERQLYMFSEKFDVDEAFDRITGLSHYFFTEKYQEGIAELNKKLGLNLEAKHERKTPVEVKITRKQKARLKKKLKSEYELYNRLWEFKEKQNE